MVFVLFEKMRRLKASTPLSVAGVRGTLAEEEEEEEDVVLEAARKGLSVGMLGGAAAGAGLGIGAVAGCCSGVVVDLPADIRSGTRAITPVSAHVTGQTGRDTLHKDHGPLDAALALPMPGQPNHRVHLAILHTLVPCRPQHAIANLPVSRGSSMSYLLCNRVRDAVEGREEGEDGVEGRLRRVERAARGMVQLEQKGAERAVLGGREGRRRQRRVAVVVQSVCARHRIPAEGLPREAAGRAGAGEFKFGEEGEGGDGPTRNAARGERANHRWPEMIDRATQPCPVNSKYRTRDPVAN